MTDYDLALLNDKDFEKLVADLLSAEFGVAVERFKPGKDGGVDGRWFELSGGESILQCKHWPKASMSAIVRHISKEEKAKVDALAPERYIFACSTPLSRKNKKIIASAFAPHIKSESDVIGLEGIQDLISKHKHVERKHYKLWLSSANVLVSLINNGVLGRSDDAIVDIRAALSRYVETDDARRAREQLASARVLVIKGEPGVGKTTLAQQLVMESIADGFQLVVIERDVQEAEGSYDLEKKQIFYFDDFLGRNFLEIIADNKDSHILNFMRRVMRSENKRFILTSRTHILDRGKQLSELFRVENLNKREFELTVGHLSRMEKAKILYAHIWNGRLPPWVIEALYVNNRYLSVVDHKNYNPRIISFITDPERLVDVNPSAFWGYVKGTLDNPEAIWRHVFDRQIGKDTRDIAILVTLNGNDVDQPVLEAAFERLNVASGDNAVELGQRFNDALKLGIGSVLNRVLEVGKAARCGLFNPSIADYLLRSEVLQGRVPEVVCALRTVSSLHYAKSLVEENFVAPIVLDKVVDLVSSDLHRNQIFTGDLAIAISELIQLGHGRDDAVGYFTVVANSILPEELGFNIRRLKIFAEAIKRNLLDESIEKFEKVLGSLRMFALEVDFMVLLRECAEHLDRRFGGVRVERLRQAMVDAWQEYANDVIVDAGILDNYIHQGEVDEARQVVKNYIIETFGKIGFPLSLNEVVDFAFEVDYEDILNDNMVAASRDFQREDVRSIVGASDAEIVDYFDRSGQSPSDQE